MPATASLRRSSVEVGWVAFAAANLVAMVRWPSWETVPFHFVWISLTLVYGFRVWRLSSTALVLAAVIVLTGTSITEDAFHGVQLWGELFEVPLMAAMFVAMVWHAQRRRAAVAIAERHAEEQRALVEREERFVHDASHELRTPVTIARGHLELLRDAPPEVGVALDELKRIDHIVERLLVLAEAGQPDFVLPAELELEPFLEDVFMRWSEVAPRAWRLGPLAAGTLRADPDRLRAALDALLENAVKYTDPYDRIELRARTRSGGVAIEIEDAGRGVPAEAHDRIFERFARADPARTRTQGGVGLGLAIADAIAKGHGGSCTLATGSGGSTFGLSLPGFDPAADARPPAGGAVWAVPAEA